MYGKHFESMYEGSMVGAGPVAFALMGYVIARTRKSRIELNPILLGAIFGCEAKEVEKAIEWACAPDEKSRNPEHEGRRLIKEGVFQYFVTGWAIYRGLRDEDERREYNRRKQAERRAKKKGKPLPGEVSYEKAVKNGASQEELDRITDNSLREREAADEGFEHYNSPDGWKTPDEADGVK